jgi:diguanylate cyclase (GGDEF)-like protein
VRLIFKNLNILRSTINAVSRSLEFKEIVQSAGSNLAHLFDFCAFGVLWREGPVLYVYQDESCPPAFTEQIVKNMIRVFCLVSDEQVRLEQVNLQVEKAKLRPKKLGMEGSAREKSHLTLPLAMEGEILGCTSLMSDQANAFDAQDLQFFSVIGYQMAATIKHFQRFSSVKNMAIYDTLTNLYNRRHFEEKLGAETERSFARGTSLSLVMLDVDHFKRINDTFGHPQGDTVLREIAALLKTSVRKKDTVARYGGEEFILILPEAGLEAASMIAERVRRSVEGSRFEIGPNGLTVTVSLGIATFPNHSPKSKEELVRMADEALYEAKKGGRNRLCVYGPAEQRGRIPGGEA